MPIEVINVLTRRIYQFVLPLILILLAAVPPAPAMAGAAQPAENTCILLLLDESGSMAESDPSFLRNTGAKLLITLLDDGDRVGIVRFATTATRLTPELVSLRSAEDKRALLDLLADTPPDGHTDIRAALAEASSLLLNDNCQASYLILLSDGYPQLPNGLPVGYEVEAIALARSLNAPIFAIALTVEGESSFLYQLASAAVEGVVIPARTATDLLDAYLEVIARLKDRTVSGSGFVTSPAFAVLPLEPGLAQYVSRVTYVVSKPAAISTAFTAPGGSQLAPGDPRLNFTYTADPRFAVYTVDNPAPGDWGFTLTGAGEVQARAILRSRLRVVAEQPATYHPLNAPMLITARMVEENEQGMAITLIGEAVFSAYIIRPDGSQDAVDQLYDDGTHGDGRANDGLFSAQYVKTDLPGDYLLTLTGYKGLIPASRTQRVLVVPFPQIVIDEPGEPEFAFRGRPLALAFHLEGGDPPMLDSGSFVAAITDLYGRTTTLPLHLAGGEPSRFQADFLPAADGLHQIKFSPQAATYKGVPYTLEAQVPIQIRLVPALAVATTEVSLGLVEAAELAQGLVVHLDIASSSPQAETITFAIAGQPALAIVGTSPKQLPAGQSTVYLTIQGDISPGVHQAAIVLSARDGLDVLDREIPISLEVYQPILAVQPEQLNLAPIRVDRLEQGEEVTIHITSVSHKDESLTLSWEGPAGLTIGNGPVTIPADQTLSLPLHFRAEEGHELSEGVYTGRLRLTGREGVTITPSIVEVTLTVVPIPLCARLCLPLGGGSLALFLVVAAAITYLAGRQRPWGTLKPLKVPVGQSLPAVIPIRSSFLHASQAVIGNAGRANIRLLGGNVLPAHATIQVSRQTLVERVGRPPKAVSVNKTVNVLTNLGSGLVKVGNIIVVQGQQSAPLRSGTRLVIGDYELEYRE